MYYSLHLIALDWVLGGLSGLCCSSWMTPKLTFVSGQVRALRFPLIQPRLAFKTTRHVACGCRHLRPKVPPKPPDMFHHVSGYSTSSIEKRFHLHPSLVLLTSLAILVWDRSCSPTPSTPKSVKATIQDETTKGCQRPCLKSPKKKEKIGAWSERWDILTLQRRSKKYHK